MKYKYNIILGKKATILGEISYGLDADDRVVWRPLQGLQGAGRQRDIEVLRSFKTSMWFGFKITLGTFKLTLDMFWHHILVCHSVISVSWPSGWFNWRTIITGKRMECIKRRSWKGTAGKNVSYWISLNTHKYWHGCLPAVQACSAAVQGFLCPTRTGGRAGEQPWTAAKQPWTAAEQPWTAAEQPCTAAEQPCTAAEQPGTTAEQLAGRQLNNLLGQIFGEVKLLNYFFFYNQITFWKKEIVLF